MSRIRKLLQEPLAFNFEKSVNDADWTLREEQLFETTLSNHRQSFPGIKFCIFELTSTLSIKSYPRGRKMSSSYRAFRMLLRVLAAVLLFSSLNCDPTVDQLKIAVSNVREEYDGVEVVVNEGKVPGWLDGSFIRNACGAFGDINDDSTEDITRISHLFDCIDMGSSYSFKDGKTTFYNKYYDTRLNDIWKSYDMNMTNSKAFFQTAFAPYDFEQFSRLEAKLSKPGKVSSTGHVAFWQIGDRVAVWGESESDKNLGYPNSTVLINTPAHNHQEPDGTIWSVNGVYSPLSLSVWETKLAVWTIRDNRREVAAEILFNRVDLNRCADNEHYPMLAARPGYMHSFAMTEHYIILPVTSYLMDPCALQRNNSGLPFFPNFFQWYDDHSSKLLVIRKDDGQMVANISTEAFFVTHQLNSYEEDGEMHLDMLVYDDSSIYDKATFIDSIMENEAYETHVQRFRINMTDWSLLSRSELRAKTGDAIEMSNINPSILTKPYKYAYMAKRIFLTDNEIIKLNVQTKEELSYPFPGGMFIQEPFFVASPDAKDEDDGVILVQGVDANQKKGFLMILNAKTMKLTAHVTAPGLALFGLHNTFYDRSVGNRVVGAAQGLQLNSFLVVVMPLAMLLVKM
ncbi:hypothetical protein CAPTEDRAFT_203197 [Capitella teleta]|uniref:Uncharacterized protein n=1 Tax=Capitella teleta TaxID=283909 RepID=R7TT74_CAPTE|nr:hypothetical protein CAPTEDRAFT_203197 [Capitella teleta]|eukprot:ELT96834.1 hypothetical protein CAPTEDRAFT_203197 [Capitella teleta]